MKQFKQINGTLSTHLTFGLHTDLVNRVYKKVAAFPIAKIMLTPDELAEWKAELDLQNDAAKAIAASEATERLSKKDAERDRIITTIFQNIRTARNSPIAEHAEAGRRLKVIADAYKGLQREKIGEETAHTNGLLIDLDKPESAVDIATLGLTQLVSMLRDVNKSFDTVRTERADKRAASLIPKSREIRRRNDEIIQSIFRRIEVACFTASDTDRAELEQLIDKLNEIVKETKKSQKEGVSQKKKDDSTKKPGGGSKKPGGGSKKPGDDPKKPSGDDPKKPGDDPKKPSGDKDDDKGKTPKPEREEDPGEDKA